MKKVMLGAFVLLSLIFHEAKANESEQIQEAVNSSDQLQPEDIKTESEEYQCAFELLGNGYDSERFDDIVKESTARRICRKYRDETVYCAKDAANDEVFPRTLRGFYKGIKLCQKLEQEEQLAYKTKPLEAL